MFFGFGCIALLALSWVDYRLTMKVLAQGGTEKNPVIAWCMRKFGRWWWVPKLLGVVVFCVAVLTLSNHWLVAPVMIGMLSLYVWVVWHNSQQLKG